MEGIQFLFVAGICGPGFGPVKQSAQGAAFIDAALCANSQEFVLPSSST